MNKIGLLIVGAGGHAKVIADTIGTSALWSIVGFIDESKTKTHFLGQPVTHSLEDFATQFPEVRHAFVAVGHNAHRRRWLQLLREQHFSIPALCHPSASVSPSATLGAGSFVGAQAVIGAEASVGQGCIINVSAVVDHDSKVGDFTHLSPGCLVCGQAQIGADCTLGPGSIVEKMGRVSNSTELPSRTVISSSQNN